MKCENCEKEHDGKYGSGRFCSATCARGFSTKEKRSLINEKVSLKLSLPKEKKYCLQCFKEFLTRRKIKSFCSRSCASTFINIKNSKLISERAIKNNLGGNRNRSAYGWYESKFAGKVFLESSWELKVAKELDENNVNWIRPKYMEWIDSTNTKHKYYADFYLIDHDIYLDPKNNFLIIQDKEKIESVRTQNNIKLKILTKKDLNWNRILELINE